ncbi:DUF3631 domain-containing protein [Mycobacterium avium subsp. hominissuis]|uniref:DUF3631 domain-containing protein n=1 Tax=Mycobacterium avium TaxID=1764 RepID=UPI001CC3C543|nr:DUF3631 domain-containing protein [Mycobacterium avium]MBZ4558589.1 DUF3631 domain-containing protein [Mycobacterium avium subsp. hominissuis]MBZ4569624.1 DUF3631 domain-containing protein [Mycobacterium avium subsp. hominissuis]MBZ4587938.1 DUF3631 domain-containing protein [Mycobacterium avium subsp. hominissuis]MBZ4625445.1 DUF3631 domain-containing protein [Mycobacterium avium subsp. hominissuis]
MGAHINGAAVEDHGGPIAVVDGAALLDDVERFAGRFLAFPSKHHVVVLCLWILHTWAVSAFYVTPRLVLDSPEPGSGKTRVLEILALLCRSAKLTLSTTTAALYRRIAAAGDMPPTVLQDEADRVFSSKTPQTEDLVALFNSGYKAGATVDRCEGDAKNMRVVEFPVFAPVALAGLAGKMPATIMDRAIALHMRKRAPDEHVAEFRGRDAEADAVPLREQLGVWGAANFDALSAARPKMPDGVRDRAAEVWEAMLAVADIAGGDWPRRAREACRYFVLDSGDDEKLSLGVRLLRDVKAAFGDRDSMFSADIVAELTSDAESEWSDLWGKPLDQRRLAKELKRYGVRSTKVRIGARTAQGYVVDGDDGLTQAWRRYLPASPKLEQAEQPERSRSAGLLTGTSTEQAEHERNGRNTNGTAESLSEQQLFTDVPDVPDVPDVDGTWRRNCISHEDSTPKCRCGAELIYDESVSSGRCLECYVSGSSK